MAESKKNVIIVGGSLTGLMAGIVLKRLGHDVRILETDPSSIRSSQAAGIHAGAAVQEFFEKHDLTGGPWAIACSGLQFIDKQNKVVRLLNLPMQMTAWSTLYYRLRANFDGFESLYVPKAPERGADDGETMYDYGKRVIDVSLVGDHVKVQYEDVLDGDELKKPKAISADLVIAADGSRSRIREKLCDVKRPYAGYVAWRGCVVESEVSEETRNIIGDRVTIFNMKRNYILVYIIPGKNGTLEPDHRLLNFVWYYNVSNTSQEYAEMMTDSTGYRHHFTIPPGKMATSVWSKQKAYARTEFPTAMSELISKTTSPFVTAVSETQMSRATFLPSPITKEPKLLVVGDALSQFRPHVALSSNQSALHALLLEKFLTGKESLAKWERQVLQYGNEKRLLSKILGTFAQFGLVAMGKAVVEYGCCVIRNWLTNIFWRIS